VREKDNGGPAFPWNGESSGMTLRDYFAGQALTGLVASWNRKFDMIADYFSDDAYRIADAMLAARKNGGAA